jgi:virginiamycin B lyase
VYKQILTTIFALCLFISLPVISADHAGKRIKIIDPEGKAIPGAMLGWLDDNGLEHTHFSDVRGEGVLPLPADSWRIRASGYTEVNPGPTVDENTITVTLKPDRDFLASLPSSHWVGLLPEGDMKREFIVNCLTCHEISQPRVMLNEKPRDSNDWLAAITMMRAIDAFEVIPPDFDDETVAIWLAEHLNQDAINTLTPASQAKPEAVSNLTITEFPLPQSDSLPHDLVVGPDGRIWITAFFYDEIWALEPSNGDIQVYPLDDDAEVNAQPRALKFDRAGSLWIVNGGTKTVVRLDTKTGQYQSYDVQMYAHSLDIDPAGNIWVNDYFAGKERVAKVNPTTGTVTILSIPASNRPQSEGFPLSYGLQVDRQGRLFSTQLAANTLAVYNTITGSKKLFEMPQQNSGPRRPGLGPDGRLWIPEFNTGYLTSFDPDTRDFERINLGLSTLGAYDVEVDQRTGEVWITGSLDSSMLRYNPESGAIDRIPLPTEPAYTRHIAIDPVNGDVWTAYSSMPAAKPKVVRLHYGNNP